MRRAIWTLLIMLAFASSAGAQAGLDALSGTWQTGARAGSWGYVTFNACGAAICGTLVGGGGANVQERYFGTRIVEGMRWSGERFEDGRILDVEADRWYISRMEFRGPDRLRVQGCVAGGLLCGGQTWQRVAP